MLALRKPLLWLVLMAFSLYSGWVLMQVGYIGIWQAGFQSGASFQILLDLIISCALIGIWIIQDARARGRPYWPWLLALLTLGSIASLGYLIARERGPSTP